MKMINVENVYDEDKFLKKEHVLNLMDWIDKQGHLPKFDELDVARFLISCNYNNEFAKRTIEHNATMRTYMPEIYQNRSYEDIEKSFDVTLSCLLPSLSPEGYNLSYITLMDKDPSHFVLKDAIKKLDMQVTSYRTILATSLGQIVIMDCGGAAMGHILKFDLILARKYLLFIQDALPLRLKAIHFINCNAVFDKLLGLVKPFIRKELFSVLNIHKNMESFYKCVSQECMPKEYGGKAGSINELNEIARKHLKDNAEYLRNEEKLVVDESKRADKTKSGNVFGTEGTFKKLELD